MRPVRRKKKGCSELCEFEIRHAGMLLGRTVGSTLPLPHLLLLSDEEKKTRRKWYETAPCFREAVGKFFGVKPRIRLFPAYGKSFVWPRICMVALLVFRRRVMSCFRPNSVQPSEVPKQENALRARHIVSDLKSNPERAKRSFQTTASNTCTH